MFFIKIVGYDELFSFYAIFLLMQMSRDRLPRLSVAFWQIVFRRAWYLVCRLGRCFCLLSQSKVATGNPHPLGGSQICRERCPHRSVSIVVCDFRHETAVRQTLSKAYVPINNYLSMQLLLQKNIEKGDIYA